MRSTWHGLETGKRALFAQQAGLNTVGQNVANANTPGYSRQRVNFATTASMEYPGLGKSAQPGQLGTGVIAESIERIRNQFLDAQYRNEHKSSGEWEVRRDVLNKIETIFNEPSSTGISTVFNNFYLSWQTLGRNPESLEARSVVKQAAIDLVSTLNTLNTKITELDSDIGEDISVKTGEFNMLTGQVSELNKQITTLEVLGDNANDLRDRRDYLVDQLSKIANISARELPNGVYQVSVGDQLVVDGPNPPVQLAYDVQNNTTSLTVTGGSIGGLKTARAEYMSVYKDQLDSLVNGFINGKMDVQLPNDYTFDSSVTTLPFDVTLQDGTKLAEGTAITPPYTIPKGSKITFNGINDLHAFGYTMQKPTTQAGPLFETVDGSTVFTAGNVKVAQSILDDVRNIASSFSTYTDANGDKQVKQGSGDIAFMIGESNTSVIDFKDGLPPNGSILTKGNVSDYLRAIIGQLGAQTQGAERQVQNQDALLRQIDNRRQSESGVSIDEEMSNMIRFQQSYGAAARVISTVDTMLDTIINRMAAR